MIDNLYKVEDQIYCSEISKRIKEQLMDTLLKEQMVIFEDKARKRICEMLKDVVIENIESICKLPEYEYNINVKINNKLIK